MLVLMPSTPALFSQVTSRAFMSFRVREFDILAGQSNFWGGFDSRQNHERTAAERPASSTGRSAHQHAINTAQLVKMWCPRGSAPAVDSTQIGTTIDRSMLSPIIQEV
jgi:hypothetical protein